MESMFPLQLLPMKTFWLKSAGEKSSLARQSPMLRAFLKLGSFINFPENNLLLEKCEIKIPIFTI